MRIPRAALPVLVGFLAAAAPAFADSVSVSSSSDGTTIVNGKPCRVVTRHGGDGSTSNSTTITAGGGGVSGSTTISPGGSGAGSSVTVGSGSSSSGSHSSSAAGSDCVIYKNEK
jgi:hypothetical protein